jgi:hypothetical protein
MGDHPYSIGNRTWPGIGKLIEEAGEAQQVCGKLLATGGVSSHWDGTNLRKRLQEELADLAAAIDFVVEANDLDDAGFVSTRRRNKLDLFWGWHSSVRQRFAYTPSPTEVALAAELASAQAEIVRLQDDAAMACESPPSDCGCAGCRYAAEKNA